MSVPFILPVSSSLTDAAVAYAALGFRVIPVYGVEPDGSCQCSKGSACVAIGKHPIGAAWQKASTSDPLIAREARASRPTANVGIATGPCGFGYLVCIDIDDAEAWDTFCHAKGFEVPPTLSARTGREGGGTHLFFVLAPHHDPKRLKSRRFNIGCDVKVDGGQVLAAPSVHRSGQRYAWTVMVPPSVLPDAMFEAIASELPAVRVVASQTQARADAGAAQVTRERTDAADQAYVTKALENAVLDVARCPEGGRNETLNKLASVVFQYAVHLGWSESRCVPDMERAGLSAGLDASEVRATVASAWKYALANPRPVPPPPERVAMVRGSEVVLATKVVKKQLVVETTLANAIDILRNDARWTNRIRYNQFSEQLQSIDAPWHTPDAERTARGAVHDWRDEDDARLQEWLTREYAEEWNLSDCRNAAQLVGQANGFHPVRDYLDSCVWDGVDRCESLFARYFGATGNAEYLAAVSVRWLISAVARIYEPGCKVDTLPILEGAQGLRKSSAVRALGGEWFSDTGLPIGEKDAFEQLKGRWIIELAELDSLSKAEVSATKAFISGQVDTYRAAYARRAVAVRRSCVFVGSVNPDGIGYLKDATGNRRFWPVECGEIDLEAIAADRDQIWAEAKVRYRAAQKWWMDTEELEALCKEVQEDRFQCDEWETVISQWATRNRGEKTIADIAVSALGMNAKDINRGVQTRIGSVLKRLKIRKVNKEETRNGKRVQWKVWVLE